MGVSEGSNHVSDFSEDEEGVHHDLCHGELRFTHNKLIVGLHPLFHFIPLNSDELPRQQLRLHVGQFRQLRGHGPHPRGGSLHQGEGQGEPRHG